MKKKLSSFHCDSLVVKKYIYSSRGDTMNHLPFIVTYNLTIQLTLKKFVYYNLLLARFELVSLGSQASVLLLSFLRVFIIFINIVEIVKVLKPLKLIVEIVEIFISVTKASKYC